MMALISWKAILLSLCLWGSGGSWGGTSALQEQVHNVGSNSSSNATLLLGPVNETKESFELLEMDTTPPEDRKQDEITSQVKEISEPVPLPVPLTTPQKCHPVYAFDVVGPFRQEEAKNRNKERIYYYRETDSNEEDNSILTKDEFGLVCFTKMMNCTVPPTALSVTSRKIPNCIYFTKEFCTRKYGQMRWKGSVCPSIPLPHQDFHCALHPLGGSGGIDMAGMNVKRDNTSTGGKNNRTLTCKNSESLCLSLKPPFHARSGSSERNPPTQTLCLCAIGHTGSDCGRIDVDLFHLDLLHTIDLRNILLKYQQKDRYFIGVTLLFLLVVTLSSVLLVAAGCSFLFLKLPNFIHAKKSLTQQEQERRDSVRNHEVEGSHPHTNKVDVEQPHPPTSSLRSLSNRKHLTREQRREVVRLQWINCLQALHIRWPFPRSVNNTGESEPAPETDYGDNDLELRYHTRRMEMQRRSRSFRESQRRIPRGHGRSKGESHVSV